MLETSQVGLQLGLDLVHLLENQHLSQLCFHRLLLLGVLYIVDQQDSRNSDCHDQSKLSAPSHLHCLSDQSQNYLHFALCQVLVDESVD